MACWIAYLLVSTVTTVLLVPIEARNKSQPSCGPNGLCTFDEVLAKMGDCFSENWQPDAPASRKSRPITTLDGLELRLTRQMESLSIRVLRGVRRIEDKLKELDAVDSMNKYERYQAAAKQESLQNTQPACPPTQIVEERRPLCPSLFEGIDEWDRCYLFSNFNTTWQHAWDYCLALGSNLVTIETNKEHFLVNLMVKQRNSK